MKYDTISMAECVWGGTLCQLFASFDSLPTGSKYTTKDMRRRIS